MAYFSVTGDIFPIEAITEALSIEPTQTYKKGDIVERHDNPNLVSTKTLYRKETDWTISTGYQESYDINNQLNVILKSLEGKTEQLKHLKKKYSLEFLFMVVIQVANNESPAMYLQKTLLILLVQFKQKFILIYIFNINKNAIDIRINSVFLFENKICFILLTPQSKFCLYNLLLQFPLKNNFSTARFNFCFAVFLHFMKDWLFHATRRCVSFLFHAR